MKEMLTVNHKTDIVFIDHHLFAEYLQLQTEAERKAYRNFLKNTLPLFLKEKKKENPNFYLYLPDFMAKRLQQIAQTDEELHRIVGLYASHRFIKQFGTSEYFPNGKQPEQELVPREEQKFYKTLLDFVRKQDMKKDILLITGSDHARQSADGVIDAGLARVGCFSLEEGYIEYKVVEPKENETIYIQGKPYKLGGKMTAGGEAAIFHMNGTDDYVAKIYCTSLDEKTLKPNCVKFHNLMKKRSSKLEAFFSDSRYQIRDEQLVFPVRPIHNEYGELIGVVMRKIKENKQLHDIINNRQWPFASFDRLSLLNIALQISQKVKKAHDSGIIIGDINMRNFLIDAKGPKDIKVYLIDLDGCQIEGHPSYYETPGYSDPLWDFTSNEPRMAKNEVFTLLILLFEVLHLGAHPYMYTGGHGRDLINDYQKNMLNGDFPYKAGKPEKAKLGMKSPKEAQYIFSHMEKSLRDLFISVFSADEKGIKHCYRPTIEEVIQKLEVYIRNIEKFSQENNHLTFTNFAIPKKDRVTFKCSHSECQGKTHYRSIKEIMTKLKNGKIEKYLFCGEHLERHLEVLDFLKKESSKEERAELKQYWESQLEKRDLLGSVEQFFIAKPNHVLKEEWEKLKLSLPAAKKLQSSVSSSSDSQSEGFDSSNLEAAATHEESKKGKTGVLGFLENFLLP